MEKEYISSENMQSATDPDVTEAAQNNSTAETNTSSSENASKGSLLLYLTEWGEKNLLTAAKWAQFLSILNMVLLCFMALIGIICIISSTFRMYGVYSLVTGVAYIICAAIAFPSTWSLYGFAKKGLQACKSKNINALQESMAKIAFTFKYVGIITVVYLGLIVLAAIVGFFSAAYIE